MKRTWLKRTNPERRAEAYERNYGAKADWIRAHPCLVPGCWKFAQAAHAIARGMGGVKGDARVLVPLCFWHHAEASEHGTSARREFEVCYQLDRDDPGEGLVIIAAEYEARWAVGEDYGAPF